jgi:5-methylcytosine-specific restriction endonuclease McrA
MATINKPTSKPWNQKGQSKPWNTHNDSGRPFANAIRVNHWFYQSLAWRNTRNNFIKHHPTCQSCDKKGYTVKGYFVDHIQPLGKIEHDYNAILQACNPDNLQTLCKSCHASKTNKEIANNKHNGKQDN